MILRCYIIVLLALILSGCKEESASTTKIAGLPDPDRGKRLYLSQCVACHNRDPSKDGTTGPAIKGSSHELIESRVLRASYPPGYTPKRKSLLMKPMPFLRSAIPHLTAFLDSSSEDLK